MCDFIVDAISDCIIALCCKCLDEDKKNEKNNTLITEEENMTQPNPPNTL